MTERIGSDVYTGMADLGQIMSVVSAVMATVIGTGFIGMGIYTLKNPPPTDPSKPDDYKKVAAIMIILPLVLIAFSWFWVWVTRKSKAAAAFGGVSNMFSLFRI